MTEEITYDDIVQARVQAIEQDKVVSHVELTDDGMESLAGDVEIEAGDTVARAGDTGTLVSFEVYSGDRNILVADDGTEIEL